MGGSRRIVRGCVCAPTPVYCRAAGGSKAEGFRLSALLSVWLNLVHWILWRRIQTADKIQQLLNHFMS